MTQRPDAPATADVVCMPAPDAAQPPGGRLFWYLPSGALPERGPDGRPSLLVMGTGRGGFLQLGARLGPDEATIAGLPDRLPAGPDGGAPRVGPAPVSATAVEVLLAVGDGEPAVLARAVPAGEMPCAVVVSVPLGPDEHRAVVDAVEGRTGVLAVRYTGLGWAPWAVAAAHGPTVAESTRRTTWSSRSTTTSTTSSSTSSCATSSSTEATGASSAPDSTPLPPLPQRVEADVSGWFAPGEGTRHVVGVRPT